MPAPPTGFFRWGLLSFLFSALCCGLWTAPLVGQSFSRLLESIKVTQVNGLEMVRFRFSQPYAGIPIEEHSQGRLAITFSGTGSSTPVRNFRVPESQVFEDIQVVQNKYSTTVSFTFKDVRLHLKGRLGFVSDKDKNVLRMNVKNSGPAKDKGSTDAALFSQMSKKITGTGAPLLPGQKATPQSAPTSPLPLAGYQGVNLWGTMLLLGVSLAAIVGGLYLLLYLYRRLFADRLSPGTGRGIKLLASFHIGPKQRIVVIDIDGEVLACGVTPGNISFLTRLQRPAQSGVGETLAGRAAVPAAGSAGHPPAAKPKDPVQQFAETLKDKVNALKRIK